MDYLVELCQKDIHDKRVGDHGKEMGGVENDGLPTKHCITLPGQNSITVLSLPHPTQPSLRFLRKLSAQGNELAEKKTIQEMILEGKVTSRSFISPAWFERLNSLSEKEKECISEIFDECTKNGMSHIAWGSKPAHHLHDDDNDDKLGANSFNFIKRLPKTYDLEVRKDYKIITQSGDDEIDEDESEVGFIVPLSSLKAAAQGEQEHAFLCEYFGVSPETTSADKLVAEYILPFMEEDEDVMNLTVDDRPQQLIALISLLLGFKLANGKRYAEDCHARNSCGDIKDIKNG